MVPWLACHVAPLSCRPSSTRLPYSAQIHPQVSALPRPARHHKTYETFFSNTIPKLRTSFVINPGFVSENYEGKFFHQTSTIKWLPTTLAHHSESYPCSCTQNHCSPYQSAVRWSIKHLSSLRNKYNKILYWYHVCLCAHWVAVLGFLNWNLSSYRLVWHD